MRKNDRGETSEVGQFGQSVQVAGDAFELGYTVEMLAPHPLLHSAELDQLPDDFGRGVSGCSDEHSESQVMCGIKSCANDVFLLLGGAQCRASAPVKFSFHRK